MVSALGLRGCIAVMAYSFGLEVWLSLTDTHVAAGMTADVGKG